MLKSKNETGFALLMTLIVVSIVISVGLSILDLSIKQIRLSTNSKDSEVAFHAANAGMECARFWRRNQSLEMETGETINPVCFGEATDSYEDNEITSGVTGDGEVFQYQYEFTWGGLEPRCTQINTWIASSSATSFAVPTNFGAGVTTTGMTTLIPGYPVSSSDPDDDYKYCEAGARCTVISVKGYNRPCSTVNGYGTVQREVLLQF